MRVFFYAALVVMAGCGFRLGGGSDLPAHWLPLAVHSGSEYSELSRDLRNELSLAGIELAKGHRGGALLRVVEEDREERDAALDRGGRVSQVEIYRSLEVTLVAADGSLIAGPARMLSRRVFDNDPDNPVAESSERNEMDRDVSLELASRVRRQLQIWSLQQSSP